MYVHTRVWPYLYFSTILLLSYTWKKKKKKENNHLTILFTYWSVYKDCLIGNVEKDNDLIPDYELEVYWFQGFGCMSNRLSDFMRVKLLLTIYYLVDWWNFEVCGFVLVT